MLKIKVCGLTDPVNAREIAGTLPDFLGYIFYPESVRFVGNKPAADLFKNIPAGIIKTGVFVNEEPSLVIEKMNSCNLDLVQLHGDEGPEYCNGLKENDLKVIKAVRINNDFNYNTLKQYIDVIDYFLFDTRSGIRGGSGLKFDWKKLIEYHLSIPFFLSGGIGPEDASLIKEISNEMLFAIDINSRFEISPGIKDPEKVKRFIDEIKC